MTTANATYWEPLWVGRRRYREVTSVETALLAEHIGPGLGRPALDICSGDGALARHLHHRLGYRTTGGDCAPIAVAAAARDTASELGPDWRLMDYASDDLRELPDTTYAVVTCRPVYRWMDDQPALLGRTQRLAPVDVLGRHRTGCGRASCCRRMG